MLLVARYKGSAQAEPLFIQRNDYVLDQEIFMPFAHFALILISVLVAAAATVWALPAAMIAVVAIKMLRR